MVHNLLDFISQVLRNEESATGTGKKWKHGRKKESKMSKKKKQRIVRASTYLTPEMELLLPFTGGKMKRLKKRRETGGIARIGQTQEYMGQTSSADQLMSKYWPTPFWSTS